MNSREIKFRIWSKELKKWVTDLFLENLSEVKFTILNGFFDDLRNNEFIVVQECAGLEDKNKTPIYEGDIIKYDGRVGWVEFIACNFKLCWEDQTDDDIGYLLTSKLEIIGNMCENPELMG